MVDIAVVGAGTMGAGIAESAALAGMSVTMIDVGRRRSSAACRPSSKTWRAA